MKKHTAKPTPWGHKRIGRMDMESDGSIVMMNQVVGTIGPDHLNNDELKDVCREIVKRWNAFERS